MEPVSRFLEGRDAVTRKSLASSCVMAAMIVMLLLTIDFRRRLTRVVSSRDVYVMCCESRIIIL